MKAPFLIKPKKAYNTNLAGKDSAFLSWYKKNTIEGQGNIPFEEQSKRGTYDYYSFYKNGEHNNKDFDIEKHFPDTYKQSKHPTFSDESIYDGNKKAGRWEGETFIPKLKLGGNLMKAPKIQPPKKKQPNPSLPNWDGMVQKADGTIGMWGNDMKIYSPKGVRLYPKGEVTSKDIDYLKSLNDSKVNQMLTRTISGKEVTPQYGAEDSDMIQSLLASKKPPLAKLKFGAFIGDNADPLSTGANFLGDAAGVFARSGKANVGLSTGQGILKGAGTGAKLGASFGPQGALIGAGIGAAAGGINALVNGKKLKAEMAEQERMQMEQAKAGAMASSAQTLADFPTNGVQGVQYYKMGGSIMKAPKFALGGNVTPEYEVEQGEVVQGDATLEEGKQVATDMHVVGGNKHHSGGVDGAGGERVFSDALKLPDFMREVLKTNKIKTTKSTTYAEVAEKLGKKKGEMEKKMVSGFKPAMNTGKIAGGRITSLLDGLFDVQEITKPASDSPKFALGGDLPKWDYDKIVNFQTYAQRNGFNFGNSGVNGKGMGVFGPKTTEAYNKLGSEYETMSNLKPSAISPLKMSTSMATAPGQVVNKTLDTPMGGGYKPGQSMLDKVLGKVQDNQGEIMNAGTFLANLGSIKKLDTTVNRNFLAAPKFNYVDRSGLAKQDNERAFRTGVQAVGNNSNAIAAMYGETLEGNNKINNAENIRRDDYVNNFNNRGDRTQAMNTQIGNEADDERRTLMNNKNVYLPQQARTAFLDGVIGNKAMKDMRGLDMRKAELGAIANDENGTLSRLAKKEGMTLQQYIAKYIKGK